LDYQVLLLPFLLLLRTAPSLLVMKHAKTLEQT